MRGRYFVVIDNEYGEEVEQYKAYTYAEAMDYANNYCNANGFTSIIEQEDVIEPEGETYWLMPDGSRHPA